MAPLLALALLTLAAAATVPPQHLRDDARVLAAFQQRVEEYVEIHRTAAAGLGDPILCAEPEEQARQSALLAVAIRDARPLAREGDIFTAVVASALRVRIAAAMRNSGLAPAADDEDAAIGVHDAIRAGTVNHLWAPAVRALPDLPPELEYQFIGRHLVLVDVDANLAVDVLRYALPAARVPRDLDAKEPCDVHPDLPACWM